MLGTKIALDTPKLLWNCCERAHFSRVLLHMTLEHFVYQEEGAPRRSLGRSSPATSATHSAPEACAATDALKAPSPRILFWRNRCRTWLRYASWSLSHETPPFESSALRGERCRVSRQREVAQPCAATGTSRVTDPCRWFSQSRFLLRECPLQAPAPSSSSHNPWPEEHGSWAQLEQQRNVGLAECSRQAGTHENIIVRAVNMTEWLSQADVVRSVNMLRVWLSVVGCGKMTFGDVCDVPSDYADTSAQICGDSEKCTARKLIVYSWS